MRSCRVWPLVILVLAAPAAARGEARADARKLVGVLELQNEATGVKTADVAFITDAVRKAAADGLDLQAFSVMTRESMDVLLPAEKITCLAGKCLAEIGRTLQAEFVVGGSIKDVGTKIGVTLEAYRSVSGELLGSEQELADTVDELVAAARLAAPRLLRRVTGGQGGGAGGSGGKVEPGVPIDRGETLVNQVTDEKGYLVIKSDPPGAAITLNGKEVGRTPLQLDPMVGRYVIVGDLGRLYHPARQELALTSKGAKVTLTLARAFGVLNLQSTPAGADVWIDGVVVGKTPYVNRQQASGAYKVRIEAVNHVPVTMDVVVSDGQTTSREASLTRDLGGLAVASDPPGASILMDERPTGKTTPATFAVLKPGVHVIRLTLEAHGDVVERATVKRGEKTTVNVKMPPRTGLLKVTATFADAAPCEGELSVDGQPVGTTPWKGEVLAKRHDVAVTCGGRTATQSVTVEHNQAQVVTLEVRGNGPDAGALSPSPREAVEVTQPVEPEGTAERAVTVPVSLSFIEGFAWYDGGAQRTAVGLEAGFALRFRKAAWIRPGLALGWTVEPPANCTVRAGLQWFFGPVPVFVRTAAAVLVTPTRAWGFVAGVGGDVPLWKDGFLTLEANATVWSRNVVPIDFRVGVGHAF